MESLLRFNALRLFLSVVPVPFVLLAQNQIPNASFENYKNLPCSLNEMYIQNLLYNWFQPLTTTTDYWNSASQADCYLNPVSVGTDANTGNGMVGIITADVFNNFGNPYRFTYQEYLGVKLITPLHGNGFYHAELYAKSRDIFTPQIPVLTTNNLGLAFTDSLIFHDSLTDSPNHILLEPQVESKEVLGNTWQKINGCFLADKRLDYLYVGNFRSIDSTEIRGTLTGSQEAYAYYFIDDVLVEELPYDVSSIPKEIAICYEDGIVELNAFVSGAISYQWQDGDTNPAKRVSAKEYSNYYVDIKFNECIYRHNFDIKEIPRVELGNDTTLCLGEMLRLSNNFSSLDLTWWDGSKSVEKYVTSSGSYSASAITEDCVLSDTITVDFGECPGFVPNVITPNSDLYNEYLVFENIGNRKWSLQVLNRWGEQVFTSPDYKNNWNGNGVPPGIYYYKLFSSELQQNVKGWVNVLK